MNEYIALLEKYLAQKNPAYSGMIETRKASLLEAAAKEVSFLDEIEKRRRERKVFNGKKPR
jgi:hypothetical protein